MITFGYVICNKKGLLKEELEYYQSIYCGLCKSLENKFGQMSRLSVNYEMTFLALFLNALYDEEEHVTEFHCPAHPIHKQKAVQNMFTEYAADMTIALAYYKCLDDWEDEGRRSRKKYADVLRKKYTEVEKQYPRQCGNISACINELRKIEKSEDSLPDDAINCSGNMLSEIFVYKDDFWSDTLRQFGYELGRFIYLMDAAMDYKLDERKKNYNPIRKAGLQPQDVEIQMMSMIGKACKEFERLPIVEEAHLLRNILYGGVWQKYYMKYRRKEHKDDRRSI